MRITKTLLKHLIKTCAEHDVEIRFDYSGRGMYGEKCIGFVGSHDYIQSAINSACLDTVKEEYLRDEFHPMVIFDRMGSYLEMFEDSKEDSMGKYDIIVYYPELEYDSDAKQYIDSEFDDDSDDSESDED
jgi:hypothetical protein